MKLEFEHHTKIKLHMLSYYLTICAKVHLKAPEKFTYFETHAGDGLAEFPDGSKKPGSAAIAASSPSRFRCVLAEKQHAGELQKNLKEQVKAIDHVKIIPGDSNANISKILEEVPPHFHSLGFVDPTHPGDLYWSTVQAIGEHKYRYFQSGEVRVPELLVNFPIGRIKRNAGWLEKPMTSRGQTALAQNDRFFGTTEWRNMWPNGDLAEFYMKRVMGFGYRDILYTVVEEIEHNVPLYYLMLFVWQTKAQEVLPGIAKNLDRWRREDYIRDYYKIHDLAKWV